MEPGFAPRLPMGPVFSTGRWVCTAIRTAVRARVKGVPPHASPLDRLDPRPWGGRPVETSPLCMREARGHTGLAQSALTRAGALRRTLAPGHRYGADARSSVTRLRALFSKRVTVNETHRARLTDRGRTAPGGTPRSTHPEPGPVPQRLPPLLLAPSWLSCFRTASRSYSLLS